MELPIGSLKETKNTSDMDFRSFVAKLGASKANGYLVLDVMTANGVEEGILLLKGGRLIGAEYTYFNKDHVVSGDEALPLVMNASAAALGILELYEFTDKKIQLIESFNKANMFKKLPNEEDIASLIPESFKRIEPKIRFERKPEAKKPEKKKGDEALDRDGLFKKYGITKPDDKKLDSMLKELES